MKPLITTILPTYRRPHLLKRAIKSVQSQTFPDLTIKVFDNASGDETEKVVRSCMNVDPRVIYTCQKSNIGAVNNFLFGMQQVETPFFSFLSDDDVLFPWFYETALDALKKTPEAGFFVGLTLACRPDGTVCKVPLEKWPREGLYYPEEGFVETAKNLPVWTGIVFKKEVVDKIGFLDPAVGHYIDADFLLRASANFPFLVSKKECAIFLSHATGISSSVHSADQSAARDPWDVIEENINKCKTVSIEARKFVNDSIKSGKEKYLISVLKRVLKERDFKAYDYFYKMSPFLTPKQRRTFYLRYFLSKYLPAVSVFWQKFKQIRRSFKRSIKKSPTMLEQLEERYGEYSKWLTLE